jgi:hypothetical protein
MDFGETGWGIMDWIHLAQDRDQWLALVNTVINLRIPLKAGDILTELLLTSQE